MLRKLFVATGFIALVAVQARAQAPRITIGGDNFDGGGTFINRTITPNLAGSSIPGTFPGSRFDVFGIVNRIVNFDFADDSAGSFAADTFGILRTGKTDNVFGSEDLTNPDNPSGTASASWTFNTANFQDLMVMIDFAAMGDFEASNDLFTFTASIDGGSAQTLFNFNGRDDLTQTYTLESGTQVVIADPLFETISGTALSNNLTTLMANIAGLGSILTLNLSATSDGGSEVFLFDNIAIQGRSTTGGPAVPEPSSLALFGMGGSALVGLAVRRRRSA